MNGSVDLRRLHVLRMVAQHGTVTAAAAALHLTPSAVSHQLRTLAHELGVPLLEPHGRRVRLTPAGETLVAYADTLHADWERARADLAQYAADGTAGVLRLAGFPTVVAGLLAPAARQLRAELPRLVVHISEVETADGFDLLLAGETDIAVVVPMPDTPPLDDPRFDQQPLLSEPLDLYVPVDHPLADQPEVVLTDAAHEDWITAAPDASDCAALVAAACTAAGFAPKIVHRAKDVVAVAALVSYGLGVSLVPRLAPVPSVHPVVRIPLRDPAPARHILSCVRRGSDQQPLIARGLEAIRAVSRNLPQAARSAGPERRPTQPAAGQAGTHAAAAHDAGPTRIPALG
jgi:DNA-binding transcriptional LysR family regulator